MGDRLAGRRALVTGTRRGIGRAIAEAYADEGARVAVLEETKTVTPELLKGGADYSPYEGRDVTGWPTQTVVRGQLAYDRGEVVGEPGHGTHVDRPI